MVWLWRGRTDVPSVIVREILSCVILSKTDFEDILHARTGSPHSVLGMHPCTWRKVKGLVVRALLRDAVRCEVVLTDPPGGVFAMERLADEGLFEAFIPNRSEVCAYELAGDVRRSARAGRSATPTASCPRSATWTFICSTKETSTGSTTSWAPTPATSGASGGSHLRYGPPPPRASP